METHSEGVEVVSLDLFFDGHRGNVTEQAVAPPRRRSVSMASKTAHSETSEHVRYPRTRQIPANDRWAPPMIDFTPLRSTYRRGRATLLYLRFRTPSANSACSTGPAPRSACRPSGFAASTRSKPTVSSVEPLIFAPVSVSDDSPDR